MSDISIDDFYGTPEPTSDGAAKVQICKVCELQLGPLELRARLSYHFDCCICEHCNNEIAREIMQRWLNDKGPRAHSTCHETFMQAEMAKRPVTVTQGLLDYLNSWRLTPDLSRSIEENQDRASAQTRKNVVEMNQDERYILMRMMQAATGTISAIVSEGKSNTENKYRREQWEAEREKRSKDLVADAEETRLSQQAQVEKKRDKKLLTKQTPEGKLLNSFLKMGMNLEQAKAMMATAHKKADENIQ